MPSIPEPSVPTRKIVRDYESGLELRYIIDYVAGEMGVGKTKARHVTEGVIYKHLMEQKPRGSCLGMAYR